MPTDPSNSATGSRAAKPVGVSPDYIRLLHGEISAKEYIRRVYAEVEAEMDEDDVEGRT